MNIRTWTANGIDFVEIDGKVYVDREWVEKAFKEIEKPLKEVQSKNEKKNEK